MALHKCTFLKLTERCFPPKNTQLQQVSPIQDLACGARRTLDSIAKKTGPSDVVSLAADRKADVIKAKYADILQAYADVHVAINHGENLDEVELEKIGKCWFCRSISILFVCIHLNFKHYSPT